MVGMVQIRSLFSRPIQLTELGRLLIQGELCGLQLRDTISRDVSKGYNKDTGDALHSVRLLVAQLLAEALSASDPNCCCKVASPRAVISHPLLQKKFN